MVQRRREAEKGWGWWGERKERSQAIGKMGNPGSEERGRAWSPALPEPAPPRWQEDLSVRSWVPSVLSPCKNGSGRKWLNPMYFYTQQPPGRPGRIICSSCVWGGMRYVWGKGLNTKRVARSHTPEPEAACANYRQKSPHSASAEVQSYWKTLLKTTPCQNEEPGEGGASVGFLWGLFRSQHHRGCWGQRQSLFQSPLTFALGLPSCVLALPPGAQTSRTLAPWIS